MEVPKLLTPISVRDLNDQQIEVSELFTKEFANHITKTTEAMDIYLECVRIIMEEIPTRTEKLEHYCAFQFYHHTYTTKAVHDLIINGFYFEAMDLLRSLLESCITIFFLYKYPNLLDLAIYEPEKFAVKFKIKKRFEEVGYSEGYGDYKNLCRFSHVSTLNIVAMFATEPGLGEFPFGMSYQEKNAGLCMYMFCRYVGTLLDCCKTIFGSLIESRDKKLHSTIDKVIKNMESESKQLNTRLFKFRNQFLNLYNVKLQEE